MLKKIYVIAGLHCLGLSAGSSEKFTDWLKSVKNDFGAFQLSIDIDQDEAGAQEAKYPGERALKEALVEALTSFINDEQDVESPLAIAAEPCVFSDDKSCSAEVLLEYLNRPTSKLLLQVDSAREIYLPSRGETINDNWIFLLTMPDLSDHLFWAIVPRDASKKVYNYGFN